VFSSISSAHSATGSRAVSASHVVASGRRRRAFHRSGIPNTHRLPLHLGAKLMSVLHVAAVMAPQPASLLETQTLGTSQADPAGASEPRRRLRPGPSRNWSLAPPSSRCLGMSLVSLLLPSRSSGLLSPQFSLTPAYCDTVAIKAFALHRLRGSIYTLDGLDTSDALLGRTAITQLLWPRLSISVCQGGFRCHQSIRHIHQRLSPRRRCNFKRRLRSMLLRSRATGSCTTPLRRGGSKIQSRVFNES